MSFVLRYVTSNGTIMEYEFERNDSIIDLSNRDIFEFDVSQLKSNNHIRELRLNGNNISRMDLTPLLSCKTLKTLRLDDATEGETILRDRTMEKISKRVVYDEITNFDSLSYLPSLDSIHVHKLKDVNQNGNCSIYFRTLYLCKVLGGWVFLILALRRQNEFSRTLPHQVSLARFKK